MKKYLDELDDLKNRMPKIIDRIAFNNDLIIIDYNPLSDINNLKGIGNNTVICPILNIAYFSCSGTNSKLSQGYFK